MVLAVTVDEKKHCAGPIKAFSQGFGNHSNQKSTKTFKIKEEKGTVLISCIEEDIQTLIHLAENRTKINNKLNLSVALNYGGRQEIVQAVKKIVADVTFEKFDIDNLDEQKFETYLETVGIPEPDLLIRTSGERRISNFLLWQCAYSELVFVDTLWPDFEEQDFLLAIKEFSERDRRYGGTRS